MKSFLFVVLGLFGFNTLADMQMGMDNMSDMVHNSGENMMNDVEDEEGFIGSFSVRYKVLGFEEGADPVSYRARIGWKGDVNDLVKWGVVLSTNTEQAFSSLGLQNVSFEQAYVSYSPVEEFSLKVGKMEWMPDFHKVGVLKSEQIYVEGVNAKYKYDMSDVGHVFVKVGAYRLTEGNEPLRNGTTLKGKLGAKLSVSDLDSYMYAMGLYDGLLKDDGVHNILTQAGLSVHSSSMAIPVGVFAHIMSDVNSFAGLSYTAGVSTGKAGSAFSTEQGDFGLAVSYYKVDTEDYRVSWLNEDYVQGAGSGVAARVQYNAWDRSSLAVKYAYNLNGDQYPNNLVGELTFAF